MVPWVSFTIELQRHEAQRGAKSVPDWRPTLGLQEPTSRRRPGFCVPPTVPVSTGDGARLEGEVARGRPDRLAMAHKPALCPATIRDRTARRQHLTHHEASPVLHTWESSDATNVTRVPFSDSCKVPGHPVGATACIRACRSRPGWQGELEARPLHTCNISGASLQQNKASGRGLRNLLVSWLCGTHTEEHQGLGSRLDLRKRCSGTFLVESVCLKVKAPHLQADELVTVKIFSRLTYIYIHTRNNTCMVVVSILYVLVVCYRKKSFLAHAPASCPTPSSGARLAMFHRRLHAVARKTRRMCRNPTRARLKTCRHFGS